MRVRLLIMLLAALLASCGGSSGGSQNSSPGPINSPTPTPTPIPTPTIPAATVTVTYLHAFQTSSVADGGQPNGPLLQASDGNFYGTTRAGGTNKCRTFENFCGTVFRITPSGDEAVLYSFGANPSDGQSPNGPLLQASNGLLYGTTSNGGLYGRGTVYQIGLDGVYKLLYSFGASPSDGSTPAAGLVEGRDGYLYGTTASGGANHCDQIPQSGSNCGAVFRIST